VAKSCVAHTKPTRRAVTASDDPIDRGGGAGYVPETKRSNFVGVLTTAVMLPSAWSWKGVRAATNW